MRPAVFALLLFSVLARAEPASRAGGAPERLLLFADRDDDDADGVADALDATVGESAEIHWLTPAELGADRSRSILLSPLVRWVADGRGIAKGARLPPRARKAGLQGISAGTARVLLGARAVDISVIEFAAVDAHGTRVDLSRSHASISRVLPSFLINDDAGAADQDALRWVAIGEETSLPQHVDILSIGASGAELDALSGVELWQLPCPPGVEADLSCRATPLIRATADRIDRAHPESAGRSLRAEVGGRLIVRVGSQKATSARVGGPRLTAIGPIERYRGRVRVHVLRSTPGGAPAVGGDAAHALELVRSEVETASLLWGQCGIHFGVGDDVAIKLVDPPPPYLIAVGCGLGLPASGGELAVRVGKRTIRVPSAAGETPLIVATRLTQAIRGAGFGATLSRNPRIDPGALETADVLVRSGEAFASVETEPGVALSSDASLRVCIGSVELADGLSHFTDFDAIAGTLEERTLIKAYADRDPTTIEVFVIPAFSGSGRVGESFLDGPSAGIHNTVIVDRAAIRAGARSHVLAHELGHVLLNMPGHPDDYGVDQPSALMDADATDPSIFGPRRLSIEECERAIRERGPGSFAPLLEPWPLTRVR